MTVRKSYSASFAVLVALWGCSEPSPPMNSDLSGQSCAITASVSYNQLTKVITGAGSLTCNRTADLFIKVCLYAKATTGMSWGAPLICRTANASSLSALTAQVEVGGGGVTATDYQTVVEAQVNGVAQPSQTSMVVTAP